MTGRWWVASIFVLGVAPLWAQTTDGPDADAPLSAIDWLSESVQQPETIAVLPPATDRSSRATRTPDANEDPVANSAASPNVSVQPLGTPAPRAIGLLSPDTTGLPADLWQASDTGTLIALLQAQQTDTLPALQQLLVTLIVHQGNPPTPTSTPDAFLLARVDKLLEMGALPEAQALLEAATPDTAALYRRWFDVSLLRGTEDIACRAVQGKPDVAPTAAARIFCLARSGDWSAAALTLNTGVALGDIDPASGDLLARFLDPDLFEGDGPLPQPDPVTPLTFRMFEAIGTPLTTQTLPVAFAHADLRANVGLKAQLEAAERLTRFGGLADDTLIRLYTARVPAASGGVWERARAVARLTAALDDEDESAIAAAMFSLWNEGQRVGVLIPLVAHFAPRLSQLGTDREGNAQLFRLLLLSDQYEAAALTPDLAATDPFLAAVARGDVTDAIAIRPEHRVIKDAFLAGPDPAMIALSQEGHTGEAILRTLATVNQGLDGDPRALQDGLATLRALGLEDVARRTALQFVLVKS